MKIALNLLVVLVLFLSCKDKSSSKTTTEPEIHKGIVQEVLHVREYSYIRVLEGDQEKWLAAPITNVEKGGTYYYSKTMEMKNFESKELSKTFETIYFIEKISATEADVKSPLKTNPHPLPMVSNQQAVPGQATKPVIEKKDVNVAATENTISISELFKNRETYKNKVVRLRGEVTKYNPAIMNVNWLHIQDGTDYDGEFDLTVTSTSTVKVGDVVTIEGKVTLNKDFGAGYKYGIIIENATILN
ncbi:hypothetical protein [Aestuariivivens marinum]|uniref:hypothetical protein n=1 Tax=Aestuariivivens marinum TaxID=2913555 RepID=UPI001F5A49A6|nr:hypothetical protein [Aestuariivivens marinum]